jgi:diguanylate cyclase (GGDEF)-like protein
MKATKRLVKEKIILANLGITLRASLFCMILVPLCIIFAGVLFNADVIDIQVILPAISMEVVSLAFFLIARSMMPKVKKVSSASAAWVYRAFWFIAFNGAMYAINGTELGLAADVAFFAAVLLVSYIPCLDVPEFATLILNEALWIFVISSQTADPFGDAFVNVVICLLCCCISRISYKNRVEAYRMRHKLKRISQDALVDPLTGLLNRRGFDRQVESIWPFCVRNDYKVGLLIVDIDNFKAYNDEYGHPEGDECLKMVAETIRRTAKRTTDIVSRIGGEEFLVFIQGSKEDEMVEFADRIRKNVERLGLPHSRKAGIPFVTVSIGLEIAMPRGMDINMLYEGANVELYQAKQSGRNAVSYSGKVKRKYSALA